MFNWLVPTIAVLSAACAVALTIKARLKKEYVLIVAAVADFAMALVYIYIWVSLPQRQVPNSILLRDLAVMAVVFTNFVSNFVYLMTYKYKKSIERDNLIKALALMEAKYFSIVEMSPVAIYAFDPITGKIKFANHALLELLGYTKSDLLSRGIFDVIYSGDHEEVKSQIKSRTEKKSDIADYHLRLNAADGKLIKVRVVGRVVQNGETSILGYAMPIDA